MMTYEIIKLPSWHTKRRSISGAGRWTIWKGRLKIWLCRLLNRLGVPGAIKDIEIKDSVTGQQIKIQVGVLFTRLTVNGRDYYFHRLSGRFDGTGSGCLRQSATNLGDRLGEGDLTLTERA